MTFNEKDVRELVGTDHYGREHIILEHGPSGHMVEYQSGGLLSDNRRKKLMGELRKKVEDRS